MKSEPDAPNNGNEKAREPWQYNHVGPALRNVKSRCRQAASVDECLTIIDEEMGRYQGGVLPVEDGSAEADLLLNATPKTHLFGALRALREEIEALEDEATKARLLVWVEHMESWRSLILDVDILQKIAPSTKYLDEGGET